MMISAIAGVTLENQSTLGKAERGRASLLMMPKWRLNISRNTARIGDLADHDRREEGEAEQARGLSSGEFSSTASTVASAIMTGTWRRGSAACSSARL